MAKKLSYKPLTETEKRICLLKLKPIEKKVRRALKKTKYFCPTEFTSIMENFGFQTFNPFQSTGDLFLRDNKKKIIVKIPYLVANRPKRAVPTICVPVRGYQTIYIQPLVNTNVSEDVSWKLRGLHEDCDIHKRNVGIYRNKAVLFDW